MSYRLVIGNKNYSSWSLRAWLFLRESGIDFEEIRIAMFEEDWPGRVAKYSPAGRVPVLLDGDLALWDTLSIFEYVLEQHPKAIGWPSERTERALARSIVAEMHSGFLAVREELPQNLRRRRRRDTELSSDAQSQVRRIDQIWTRCRQQFAERGPWLFGPMTLADIMYAPVALRFLSYEIPVSPESRTYIEAVDKLPSVRAWKVDSVREVERLDFIDELRPVKGSDLTLG